MKPASSAIFTVTRYIVPACLPAQTEFRSEHEATRAAMMAARRTGSADVLVVEGEPLTGLWRRPRVLATYGEVPATD